MEVPREDSILKYIFRSNPICRRICWWNSIRQQTEPCSIRGRNASRTRARQAAHPSASLPGSGGLGAAGSREACGFCRPPRHRKNLRPQYFELTNERIRYHFPLLVYFVNFLGGGPCKCCPRYGRARRRAPPRRRARRAALAQR